MIVFCSVSDSPVILRQSECDIDPGICAGPEAGRQVINQFIIHFYSSLSNPPTDN